MIPTATELDRGTMALRLLDALTDPVLACDGDSRVTFANAAAARLAGRPRDELVGDLLWDVAPERIPARLRRTCRRAIRTGAGVRSRSFEAPAGTWTQAQVDPVDAGFTLRLRDVTQEMEAARARRAALTRERGARERAERAVRERDEVVAMVAHDLKNPLHTIALAVHVLENLPVDEAERVEKRAIIRATVARMERLIGGLLDMRRIEAGEALVVAPEPCPVGPLVDEACGLFAPQIEEKRLRVVRDVAPGCPDVLVDPDRVLQVFWNLVGNAVKFTPPGGTIHVGCAPEDDGVRFTVRDSGPGVADEHLDRLFDPFWQEKRTSRLGTGLGLPIAKGIVDAHGGSIRVESRAGEGTEFSFSVPAVPWREGDSERRGGDRRRRPRAGGG